jgi:hypothetical protein
MRMKLLPSEPFQNVALSTEVTTWIVLGLNPNLRGEIPAINNMRHSAGYFVVRYSYVYNG